MTQPARIACLVAAFALPGVLSACRAAPPAAEIEQPVILAVTSPAHLQDPPWLQQTATRAGGRLRFRAAISPDTAAFVLSCSATDTGCGQTIARLRSQPGVRLVEPDQKVRVP
ncbi:hypothetical protein [Uliginosibacterium sp. H1]|uniref:hypothetical protein n=1 Tax=Uliginosibacterium sp. H1 TaxID=3114757 RepID=UPI002E184D7A|nr:hypothetical protein [Uliginosibacterium sp. H1]